MAPLSGKRGCGGRPLESKRFRSGDNLDIGGRRWHADFAYILPEGRLGACNLIHNRDHLRYAQSPSVCDVPRIPANQWQLSLAGGHRSALVVRASRLTD